MIPIVRWYRSLPKYKPAMKVQTIVDVIITKAEKWLTNHKTYRKSSHEDNIASGAD